MHDAYPAEDFVDKLAKKGVLCNTFGKQQVRLVTHLDVSAEMVEYIKDLREMNKTRKEQYKSSDAYFFADKELSKLDRKKRMGEA